MKHVFLSISVLCLLAAGTMSSCKKLDDIPGNEPEPQQPVPTAITFTATLAPKSEASQSKAITSGYEASKEVLNVSWAKNEYIAIYYQKTDDTYATAMATIGTPSVDGSAPITATLTNAKGGIAKFIYPYTLAKNGELNSGSGSDFRKQDGTLDFISRNLDAATATGTINVSGNSATVSGSVKMKNEVCICRFSFNGMENDPTESFYDITIREKQGTTTTNTYMTSSIARASMGAVYIAMLGAEGKDFIFSVQGYNKSSATDPNGILKNHYETNSSNVTLTAGNFYRRIPVNIGNNGSSTPEPIYHTIIIPDGDTYTLNSVTFSATEEPAILCEGDATIILVGVNCLTASDAFPAIQAGPEGTTLTITGNGFLSAEGGSYAAGIGCGSIKENRVCGNIIITGGTIEAHGGDWAAGIGSGYGGTCGDITITDAVTRVTAYRDSNAWCIGKGVSHGETFSSCGTVTIGDVAMGESDFISSDSYTYEPQH